MAAPEASRTFHASQAVQISDLIALKFVDQRFGTAVPRVLKVTEPDGPSTDGGLKARQSILLAPEDPSSAQAAIVCGFLDVSRRSAELRPFAVVSQQHQQRYGGNIDITKGEYERCIHDLHEFLRAQAIDSRVAVTAATRSPSMVPRRSLPPTSAVDDATQRTTMALVAVLAFLLGFAACYLLVRIGAFSHG
ncbi:MAG: hypothetical protein U1E65_33815 [Myxococcota bacterium]